MSLFFGKQPDPKPLPAWLKIAIVLFVFYSLIVSATGKKPDALQTNAEFQQIDWSRQFDWQDYKSKVFPDMSGPLRITDTKAGEGEAAHCGQDVTIRYASFTPDNTLIESNKEAQEPLTFALGSGTMPPALEQGIIGMKKGGTRTIAAVASLAYGAEKFKAEHPNLAVSMVKFDVELLDAGPNVRMAASDSQLNMRSFDYALSASHTLACGDAAMIMLSVWRAADGALLYSNMEQEQKPLSLRLGAAQAPLGLEEGLLGLSPDRQRTLIIPPQWNRYLREKPLEGERILPISLPEGETLIMDIAVIPPPITHDPKPTTQTP